MRKILLPLALCLALAVLAAGSVAQQAKAIPGFTCTIYQSKPEGPDYTPTIGGMGYVIGSRVVVSCTRPVYEMVIYSGLWEHHEPFSANLVSQWSGVCHDCIQGIIYPMPETACIRGGATVYRYQHRVDGHIGYVDENNEFQRIDLEDIQWPNPDYPLQHEGQPGANSGFTYTQCAPTS